MYCPQCGIENAVEAETCVSCGFDLRTPEERDPYQDAPHPPVYAPQPPPTYAQPYPGQVHEPPRNIPNYLPQAITLTVIGVCCWTLPGLVGIPAIVFASQVNTKLHVGDVAGAMSASRNARIWCWVSFGLLIAVAFLWGALILVSVAAGA